MSDPAAGSGGIESLTQALCEAAWALFQEIEKAGGVFAALEQNLIQRKVAATRAEREANIARRKEVLTGASDFPNLNEAQVAALDVKAVALAPYGEAKITFDALSPMRLAAPFERLRDRSDEMLKAKGTRPKVFLANLGTAADFTARATFAKSFFETGGIEAIVTGRFYGFGGALGRLQGFRRGARLHLFVRQGLCRTRRRCGQGPSSGRRQTYLSGRAGGRAGGSLRTAGVNEFIFAGGDALAACNRPTSSWRRHDDGKTCSDRRLPMRRDPLCAVGAAYQGQHLPLPDVPESVGRAVCFLCRDRKERFRLDPRPAGRVPLLLDRRARLLPGLRHAA